MKQISAFLLLACIVSCKGSSSPINLDKEKQVHSALIGKWESIYMETTAGRMEVPKETVAVITYKANGTYETRRKGGVIANKGNWSYDPKAHRFNNTLNGEPYYQGVASLTEQELVLINYIFSNDQIVDSTIETFRKL